MESHDHSEELSRRKFLAACHESALLSAVLKRLNLTFTEKLLGENAIVPGKNGKYQRQQVMELYNKIAPHGLQEVKNIAHDNKLSEAKRFVPFIKGIKGLEDSSELRHLLLLLLSSPFNSDVQKIRSEYGIPAEGFMTEIEAVKWAGVDDDKYLRPFSASFGVGIDDETYAKFTVQAKRLFEEIEPQILELIDLYRLGIRPFTLKIYLFHGMNVLDLLQADLNIHKLKPKMDVTTPTQRFAHYAGEWSDSIAEMEARLPKDIENGKPLKDTIQLIYPTLEKDPRNFFFCFRINSPVLTKEEMLAFFDKHFEQIKEEFQRFRPALIPSGEFGRHWLVFFLKNQIGLQSSQINTLLTEGGLETVTSGNSRIIVMRVTNDIQEVERYKKS